MATKDEFFKPGMGTRINKSTWRYIRKDMRPFLPRYQAISIPMFDLPRIKEEIAKQDGLRKILVKCRASGFKYELPVELLDKGKKHFMPKWAEPEQWFVSIQHWNMPVGR
jgi:hypothetical protein